MAQDLMLLLDADAQVKIEPDPATSQLQIWIEVEKPFKEALWKKFIERKLPLNSIRSFDFDHHHGKDLTLDFSFGKMSQGTLKLYEKDSLSNGRVYSIELPGIPAPIKGQSGDDKKSSNVRGNIAEKSSALYPAEVYEELQKDAKKDKKNN